MLPGSLAADIDFIDEALVQCGVPVIENAFAGNLQMITNKF